VSKLPLQLGASVSSACGSWHRLFSSTPFIRVTGEQRLYLPGEFWSIAEWRDEGRGERKCCCETVSGKGGQSTCKRDKALLPLSALQTAV